jgi:hypothetical protein
MIETATLVLAGLSFALALYGVVVKHIAERNRRAAEWQGQFNALKAENRRNLEHIAALEQENLNDKAIEQSPIRRLIAQLETGRCEAAGFDFFRTLCRRRAKAARSALDPFRLFSAAREAAEKIRSVKDRAELAEENAPNAPQTLLKPRIEAIKTRLEEIGSTLRAGGAG